MESNHPTFKDVAWRLTPYITNPSTLLEATQDILDMFPQAREVKSPDGKATWDGFNWNFTHDNLVDVALNNESIMYDVRWGRKIQAIKTLRNETNCGLKAAKEAVEDMRVFQTRKEQEALDALREKLAVAKPGDEDPWYNVNNIDRN